MHYNKEFHLTSYIYLYNHYKGFITDLSNRLCMVSWLGSAHSSGSATTTKTSKSGTNNLDMQFRRSWVGSQFNSSKYLRSSCCLLFWHLTVWCFSGGPTFIGHTSLFRWFKFTLKPPNSITHGNLLSAIWDTSHWNFFVKFGLKTAWQISYEILWSLLTYVNFRRLQGHLSTFAKIRGLQKIKVFSMKEQSVVDEAWGF